MNALRVKLLSSGARCPEKAKPDDAGFDLFASRACSVPARGWTTVDTDVAVAVPAGCYGRVAPRSGLAARLGIDVGAGVVDAGYRGPVGVVLFNHGDKPFDVQPGARVAQLILEKIDAHAEAVVVPDLDATDRGAAGFGSTGGFTAPARHPPDAPKPAAEAAHPAHTAPVRAVATVRGAAAYPVLPKPSPGASSTGQRTDAPMRSTTDRS